VELFRFSKPCLPHRLKLSPSPSSRVTVSRVSGSSSNITKRKRLEVEEGAFAEEAGQLLVSEEATASGAVTILPTDMDGNAVTLANDTDQVHPPYLTSSY